MTAQILEMIVSNRKLPEILAQLALAIERQIGTLCSILMLDPTERYLFVGAGPSLPAGFNEAVNGLEIGPRKGSCGTAAYTGKPVIVADIATDPLWPSHSKQLALRYGLKACWSTPILSPSHRVLGTFALYYLYPTKPAPEHLHCVEEATHMARLAIERAQMQEILLQSEERFRVLFDDAPVAYHEVDEFGTLQRVNRAECALLGYTAAEMLGRNAADFLVPEDREASRESIRQKISTLAPIDSSVRRYLTRDGRMLVIEAHENRTTNESGRTTGLRTALLDITSRLNAEKALAENELLFRTIFQQSAIGIALIDKVGRPIRTNPALSDMFGFDAAELQSYTFASITHPDDVSSDAALFQQLVAGARDSYQIEKRFLRKDGKIVWSRLVVSAVRSGDEFQFAIGMVEDITGQKKTEQDRELYLEKVEEANRVTKQQARQLLRQAEELEKARDSALQLAREKSDFLAVASHEIRTPLNGIIGMTCLALATSLTTEQQDYIRTVHNCATQLLQVVEDVLDFSKMEAVRMEIDLEEFRLSDCLGRVLQTARVIANQKGLQLSLLVDSQVPSRLIGDPRRLSRVIMNLLGNAIKFTENGEIAIEVTVQSLNLTACSLCFAVKDSGIGIEPEKRSRIFEAFVQADGSIRRRYGGTGLGLAISAKLVHLMNGQIDVDSEPGKGSTFYFTLPFQIGASEQRASIPYQERNQPKKEEAISLRTRILLAEDNIVNQRVARALLSKRGYDVTVVDDGRKVLEAIRTSPFDLILMDVQMPELDGLAATKAIRDLEAKRRHGEQHSCNGEKSFQKSRIPIIAMTAHAMAGDQERCLAVDMDDYISKPFQPSELYSKIERLVRQRRNGEPAIC